MSVNLDKGWRVLFLKSGDFGVTNLWKRSRAETSPSINFDFFKSDGKKCPSRKSFEERCMDYFVHGVGLKINNY
jgi:hypothetical protein